MKFDISEPVVVRRGAHTFTRILTGGKHTKFITSGMPVWATFGAFIVSICESKYRVQCIDTDKSFWIDEADIESAL